MPPPRLPLHQWKYSTPTPTLHGWAGFVIPVTLVFLLHHINFSTRRKIFNISLPRNTRVNRIRTMRSERRRRVKKFVEVLYIYARRNDKIRRRRIFIVMDGSQYVWWLMTYEKRYITGGIAPLRYYIYVGNISYVMWQTRRRWLFLITFISLFRGRRRIQWSVSFWFNLSLLNFKVIDVIYGANLRVFDVCAYVCVCVYGIVVTRWQYRDRRRGFFVAISRIPFTGMFCVRVRDPKGDFNSEY